MVLITSALVLQKGEEIFRISERESDPNAINLILEAGATTKVLVHPIAVKITNGTALKEAQNSVQTHYMKSDPHKYQV